MYNRYYPYRYNPPKRQINSSNSIVENSQSCSQKEKFNFSSFRKNTCSSLNDVECFLNNFSHTWKYIRLIKLLK